MPESHSFVVAILMIATVGLLALLSSRLTEHLKVPAPLLVLLASAAAVEAIPSLHSPPQRTVQQLVTLALLGILFDGGLNIGWRRFRLAAVPIGIVGVLGTFLTVAGAAVFVHFAFRLGWYLALLVATAVAPTDPAVVFSVLGQREVAGRSGTILEGESGANDPVGISLMASLIAAGGIGGGAFAHIAGEFALQMTVGLAIGVVGGRALVWFVRTVPLPSAGLYPLRTAASGLLIYGVAAIAHGSGFLAVFVAGIVLGDERVPYKRDIRQFHTALGSLGEIVAFVVLGLTVDLAELAHPDVWIPGLLLGIVLSAVIRPLFVSGCLVPARLKRNERLFVLFAGLKGAVPILLAGSLLTAHVADAERLYGIVVVVVIFSVVVQGSLVPTVTRLLHLRVRAIEPEPWSLGVRVGEAPRGVHRLTIQKGAPADGRRIADLTELPDDAWISLVLRANRLLVLRGDTELRAGDEVIVLADSDVDAQLRSTFSRPERGTSK